MFRRNSTFVFFCFGPLVDQTEIVLVSTHDKGQGPRGNVQSCRLLQNVSANARRPNDGHRVLA
jgi:hypothetical protein